MAIFVIGDITSMLIAVTGNENGQMPWVVPVCVAKVTSQDHRSLF